jgi:hypothetical protein
MDMKDLLKCFVLAMCALPAFAQESSSLKLTPKLMVQSSAVAPWRAGGAPIASAPSPAPLFLQVSVEHEHIPGSCDVSAGALCYDYRNGSSVYKPSRQLMPEISGMQSESVALKRNKITFKYSFR